LQGLPAPPLPSIFAQFKFSLFLAVPLFIGQLCCDIPFRLRPFIGWFLVNGVQRYLFDIRQLAFCVEPVAYDLLLKICELLHSALLPDPKGKGSKFSDILDDENEMDRVFEAFVRNFFRVEQTEFPSVKAEWIQWDAQIVDANSTQYLPAMHTDITLRSKGRVIIIDTKFYREALAESQFGDKKVRSDHLYQLFSYLRNVKSQPGNECLAEGILLYPAVSQSLDLKFIIGGHQVRVRTIRLDQPWQHIHAELCSLLSSPHRPQLEPMVA
jgi:5-methylcytosine-specific restriction enzyme subunit McrC